jgi:eukaryotic-like serine/threonine-protein kinase
MAFGMRVWSAGKILMLIGALFATYLLFAVASMQVALKTRNVTVPDLSNRTTKEATSLLANLGLTLRVDEVRRSDLKVGADHVVAQEPAPGSVARRQRSVKVWLSGGQTLARVPSLTGESERTAQLRLSQGGLGVASVTQVRSDRYPADVVVAQEPPANAVGTRVTLLVNRGGNGATYVMPDLIGANGDRASEILRARGFRVSVVGSAPYPGVAAGVVLRQTPQSGFQIAPGEPVSLEVSR